jgi:hypothetical protein
MTEQEYKEKVYGEAKNVSTTDELVDFINEIKEYEHDYGTIVYGLMAAMKAAFKVVNASPQGGITGFQASCLGWECIHEFMMVSGPLRIVQYEHLLYPQYKGDFEKTIDSETWVEIMSKANQLLLDPQHASKEIISHWKSVAAGNVPFGYAVSES